MYKKFFISVVGFEYCSIKNTSDRNCKEAIAIKTYCQKEEIQVGFFTTIDVFKDI